MTTLFENLFDNSIDMINTRLPDNYEVDDVAWDEENDRFRIPVFEVSDPGRWVPEDAFWFYRYPEETNEEAADRWQREIDEFIQKW